MQHRIHVSASFEASIRVSDVGLQQLEVAGKLAQVFPLSRDEIVEDADRVAPVDQRPDEMRPDEARTAGYEDFHVGMVLSPSSFS